MKKREEFMRALTDTLKEDVDGEKFGGLTGNDNFSRIDNEGRLTI